MDNRATDIDSDANILSNNFCFGSAFPSFASQERGPKASYTKGVTSLDFDFEEGTDDLGLLDLDKLKNESMGCPHGGFDDFSDIKLGEFGYAKSSNNLPMAS